MSYYARIYHSTESLNIIYNIFIFLKAYLPHFSNILCLIHFKNIRNTYSAKITNIEKYFTCTTNTIFFNKTKKDSILLSSSNPKTNNFGTFHFIITWQSFKTLRNMIGASKKRLIKSFIDILDFCRVS